MTESDNTLADYITRCVLLESELTEARREVERLRAALDEIAYPIKAMQIEADKRGARLDGGMAILMSQDANYLKNIAKKVLSGE